jgi:ATP-dependent Clp protease ATP-binding subunit ClpB
MNFEKFTEKSIACVRTAKETAIEHGNQTVEEIHFLYALLGDEGGLISELVKTLGKDASQIKTEVKSLIEALPKVAGSGYSSESVYLSRGADKMLRAADKHRADMGDEYLSVEHIMLALLDTNDGKISALFKKYDINKSEFLAVLKKVRGNMRVTNENPEGSYNVLEKYGQDLVALAREHKLDPVIGRDDEIRNV